MLLRLVRSFSRSRFLISSILDPFRLNFDVLDPPLYCVFLQDRDCSSSATRKFSPNPSYLRSGELVLPWDTKNRSSHTQIVHIDILRAQMYLKSAIWAQGPNGPMGPLGPRARAQGTLNLMQNNLIFLHQNRLSCHIRRASVLDVFRILPPGYFKIK